MIVWTLLLQIPSLPLISFLFCFVSLFTGYLYHKGNMCRLETTLFPLQMTTTHTLLLRDGSFVAIQGFPQRLRLHSNTESRRRGVAISVGVMQCGLFCSFLLYDRRATSIAREWCPHARYGKMLKRDISTWKRQTVFLKPVAKAFRAPLVFSRV